MIEIRSVTMCFHSYDSRRTQTVLDGLTMTIPSGCVFGLVGPNGTGKSTLLRLLAGVYAPGSGDILLDGVPVWDNPDVKSRISFIPDDLLYSREADMKQLARHARRINPRFSPERFASLAAQFGLETDKPLRTFSKGMKRQAALVLALAEMPDVLLLDETFDGFDPVVRNHVRQLLFAEVMDRDMTVVTASHSLRELENTCDRLAILDGGHVLYETDMDAVQSSLCKVQTAFPEARGAAFYEGLGLAPLSLEQEGTVTTMILRMDCAEAEAVLRAQNPILLNVLPLDLEEIFTFELEKTGYAVRNLLV